PITRAKESHHPKSMPRRSDVTSVPIRRRLQWEDAPMVADSLVQSLLKAVAQRTTLRLSVDGGAAPRVYNARPVRLVGEDVSDGIWVHLPEEAASATAELTKAESCVGWFCLDGARYAFDTRVVKRDKHFWLNDEL